MTLAAGNPVNSYVGTGGVNTYPFTFPCFENTDLTVTATSPTGVVYSLTYNVDFNVSGLNIAGGPPSTGTISLINLGQAWLTGAYLTTGWTLTLTRILLIEQNTSLRNRGDFYPEDIESALDYVTAIAQQLSYLMSPQAVPAQNGTFSSDISILAAGDGMIVTTPDGAHTYRIAVDNNGILTTTQIS